MPKSLPSAPAAMAIAAALAACAPKPPSAGAFVLVEGSRIGKVDIIAVDYSEGLVRDSVVDKVARVARTHAITFTYPGKTINLMKVFRNGKQVKVCDEPSFDKPFRVLPPELDAALATKVETDRATGRTFHIDTGEEILEKGAMRHNIECRLEVGSGEIEVALYEFDGLVSRYRLQHLEGR